MLALILLRALAIVTKLGFEVQVKSAERYRKINNKRKWASGSLCILYAGGLKIIYGENVPKELTNLRMYGSKVGLRRNA